MGAKNYERIKSIIEFLDKNQAEQPGLETLADFAGLSPFHLHRLFSSWAGVTPKMFLKCLTLNRAKNLLLKGESVLDASLNSGLSGPGRLHDLCVTLNAASPGEIKLRGEGWRITVGFADTPFGFALLGESARGICHFSFIESQDRTIAAEMILADWPRAALVWDNKFAERRASNVFDRKAISQRKMPLTAIVRGSDFQVRVWNALLRVPAGATATYADVAQMIDVPAASRAVGSAIGKNCLAYLIPCHRVIRKTGAFGDYRWGSDRKRLMIAWDSMQSCRDTD